MKKLIGSSGISGIGLTVTIVLALIVLSLIGMPIYTRGKEQTEKLINETGWNVSVPDLSEEDREGISNWIELTQIRDNPSGHYKLTESLDEGTEGYDEYVEENGWEPIGTFKGTFDGQGHTISGLEIRKHKEEDNVGLFGVSSGKIANVGVEASSIKGRNQVGTLVGKNKGLIKSCYVRADTVVGGARWGSNDIGGLVGFNDGGKIINTYVYVDKVNGGKFIGGLVGRSDEGYIGKSYAIAKNVGGGRWGGGFIGKDVQQRLPGGDYTSTSTYEYIYADEDRASTSQFRGKGDDIESLDNSGWRTTEEMTWTEDGYDENTYVSWDMDKYGQKTWIKGDHGLGMKDPESKTPYPVLGWEGVTLNVSPSTDGGEDMGDADVSVTIEWDGEEREVTEDEEMFLIGRDEEVTLTASAGENSYFFKFAEPDTNEGFTVYKEHEKEVTVTLDSDRRVVANFKEHDPNISDWKDLNEIRDLYGGAGLEKNYTLINNLNESTEGYEEYVNETANELNYTGEWEKETDYKKNDLVNNTNDEYYYCVREHTSSSESEPGSGGEWSEYWVETTKEEGDALRWEPIGTEVNPFTGTFDGNGHTVSDLYINRSDENRTGLFGVVGEGGMIKNVTIKDANIKGNYHVGSLVGLNYGTVTDCDTSGTVEITREGEGKDLVGTITKNSEN